MKNFSHNWLLSILLLSSPFSLAFAAFPVMPNPVSHSTTNQGAMENSLEKFSQVNVNEKCGANLGAAGQKACVDSYNGAKEAVDKYNAAKAKATTEIQALTSQNAAMCGANRSSAAQKSCFEGTASNYTKAAELQLDLVNNYLMAAYNKAQKWQEENEAALKKYQDDLNKIATLQNDARNRATTLRSQGDTQAAALTMQQVEMAPTANFSGVSVAAAVGAASSIIEYKGKVPQLSQEQYNAKDYANRFAKAAKSEADRMITQSENFRTMAEKARAQAAAVTTAGTDPSNSGISDGKKVPVPGDGTAARAEYKSAQGTPAGSGTGTGGKGISGPTNSPATETTAYDNSAATNTTQSNPSTTPATSAAAATPTAAAMPAAAASSVASGNTNPGADPFAGMNNPAALNGGQQQVADSQVKSANFGEVLGTHDPRKKEDKQEALAEAEVKDESSPEQVAAAGGLSGSLGEETSGASSSPGIRGADGKPLRTGFSSANGGDLQSSRRNADRDAAGSREQFSPDLKSGAVSIAGSEMKSAMQSLAEELGATDLDLDLGDLTSEEKAALAPLEGGGEGVRNLAPIKNGRQTASVIQGSDASIQDEFSAALFSRTRSAHERAIRRGNLILGTKKKL